MKKIDSNEYMILIAVMGDRAREIYNDEIRISVLEENQGKVVFGVNWCCMGTVKSTKAVEFAHSLVKESELADKLNALNLVVDWGLIGSIKDREAYERRYKEIKEMIEKMA